MITEKLDQNYFFLNNYLPLLVIPFVLEVMANPFCKNSLCNSSFAKLASQRADLQCLQQNPCPIELRKTLFVLDVVAENLNPSSIYFRGTILQCILKHFPSGPVCNAFYGESIELASTARIPVLLKRMSLLAFGLLNIVEVAEEDIQCRGTVREVGRAKTYLSDCRSFLLANN